MPVVLRTLFPSFCTTLLPWTIANDDTEVILDFLKFLHMPPHQAVGTYRELCDYVWQNVICLYGFDRGAKVVTLVIDKPNYLPLIRDLIHDERKATHLPFICPPHIKDNDKVPHGQNFASALSNKFYKQMLINYMCTYLCEKARQSLVENKCLIIDSPTYDQVPRMVKNGEVSSAISRKNNKVEADIAIWWHVKFSHCKQILVHASDTDIYLYGAALMDLDFFQKDKKIAVETKLNKLFIPINQLHYQLNSEPVLRQLSDRPALTMLAIYLLSGSDYVSNFFGLTVSTIVSSVMQNAALIKTCGQPLINTNSLGQESSFEGLSIESFVMLFSCAYLEKNLSFYQHLYPTVGRLAAALRLNTASTINPSLKALFGMLDIDHSSGFNADSIPKVTDFTRRVCYFNHKGKATVFHSLYNCRQPLQL